MAGGVGHRAGQHAGIGVQHQHGIVHLLHAQDGQHVVHVGPHPHGGRGEVRAIAAAGEGGRMRLMARRAQA